MEVEPVCVLCPMRLCNTCFLSVASPAVFGRQFLHRFQIQRRDEASDMEINRAIGFCRGKNFKSLLLSWLWLLGFITSGLRGLLVFLVVVLEGLMMC